MSFTWYCFIHVLMCSNSFILLAVWYSVVWICDLSVLLILRLFSVKAMWNNAALIIAVQNSWYFCAYSSVGYIFQREISSCVCIYMCVCVYVCIYSEYKLFFCKYLCYLATCFSTFCSSLFFWWAETLQFIHLFSFLFSTFCMLWNKSHTCPCPKFMKKKLPE